MTDRTSRFLTLDSLRGLAATAVAIYHSIYLNQITVLLTITYFLSKLGTPKWLGLLIYLSVLFVYSHFTFKYIEKPLRSKGRNILSGFFNGQTKKNQAS